MLRVQQRTEVAGDRGRCGSVVSTGCQRYGAPTELAKPSSTVAQARAELGGHQARGVAGGWWSGGRRCGSRHVGSESDSDAVWARSTPIALSCGFDLLLCKQALLLASPCRLWICLSRAPVDGGSVMASWFQWIMDACIGKQDHERKKG